MLVSALAILLATAVATSASAIQQRDNDDHAPSSTPQFEYLFTINYAFGGASPIIFSQGVVENGTCVTTMALTSPANTFVGASITGPALNGEISRGVITNRFVAYGSDTIVFEEATWFGTFYNGDKGNGTMIARTQGLVDYKLYEQQRVVSCVANVCVC